MVVTIAACLVLGNLVVAAGTGDQPYVPMFQDLEVSEQSSETDLTVVGGGFAPNSDVSITIVDNSTGDVVYESTATVDAVGQADLDLTLETGFPPGAYTTTVTGSAAGDEPIQLSGALTIAETFAPATTQPAGGSESTTEADSESIEATTGIPNDGADGENTEATAAAASAAAGDTQGTLADVDAEPAEPAANAGEASDSAGSSTALWLLGGFLAILFVGIIAALSRRSRSRRQVSP